MSEGVGGSVGADLVAIEARRELDERARRHAGSNEHRPTTFWHPCFLCEHATHLQQVADLNRERVQP